MDLGAVMDEIGDRLDTLDGLRVYRYPPDNVQPPAAIVTYPDTYTYDETMRRGMDRITLPVVLLVGKVSDRASRDRISDWLSRGGVHQYGIETPDQLTKHTFSAVASHASGAEVNDGNLEFTLTSGTAQGISQLRDVYIRDGISGSDFHARTTFDPPFFGDRGDGTLILPQSGLVLRYQADTVQRAVMIWQNIFFGLPTLLVGVWQANLDGTGFVNRQATGFPPPLGQALPYTVEAKLTGNIVNVRQWRVGAAVPAWNDPILARTINLDTDAGNPAGSPTPVGVGGAGLVAAHLSADVSPPSMVRYPLADTYFELSSTSIKETLEDDVEAYTAFDSLRVADAEFDIVAMAGVEYLAATLHIDISGEGA